MKRELIRTTLKVRVRIIRPDWKHFFLAALPLVNNTCFCFFLSFLFCFLFILIIYSLYLVLGPVDTYPFSFETQLFLYGYGFRPHVFDENDQWKGNFSKTLSRVELFETLFSRVRVDRRKKNFSRTLKTHYQFQSTPHNIKNLLKMADGRFPLLSFMLRLIFNPIACFQANLSWLFQEAAEPIIRLLSLLVSRGGRLDLPLLWLCWLWRTSQQEYKPTPKKFKDGANLVFLRVHNSEHACAVG